MRISICGTKWIAALAMLVVALASGHTQEATVSYLEGAVNLKNSAGKLADLDFGSPVKTGESVITKRDGRADLELPNKSTISVKPNSVFTMGEIEVNGKKETVFSAPLGQVAFKFNKFAGNEPRIRSSSAVMGVRGTEFTVYSGMDGSSLLVVTAGAVELESAGKTVALEPNEAVEVKPGEQPGQKFAWKGKELDFSAWNKGKQEEFLKDPVGGITRVQTQLNFFNGEIKQILPAFYKTDDALKKANEELKNITAQNDKEKFELFRKTVYFPLLREWQVIHQNLRYFVLSYHSMRRFVVSNMYMKIKTLVSVGEYYNQFMKIYDNIISQNESEIVQHLVEADI